MRKQPQRKPEHGKSAATAPEPTVLRMRREFQELARHVPKEEWDRFPPDFLDNLDHYLYGTPKRPSRR